MFDGAPRWALMTIKALERVTIRSGGSSGSSVSVLRAVVEWLSCRSRSAGRARGRLFGFWLAAYSARKIVSHRVSADIKLEGLVFVGVTFAGR
jgi:hypothetical protein